MARLVPVRIDDDQLVEEAVRLGGYRTKKETVHEALREYIRHRQPANERKIDSDPKEDHKKPRRRK